MTSSTTRVAILATSEKTQQALATLLQEAGLEVVAHELPSDDFLSRLNQASADVLLVDLSEENGSETDIIDTLLDFDELPIFFNDSSPAGGGANANWAKKLARKLATVAESFSPPLAPAKSEPTLAPVEISIETSLEIEAIAHAPTAEASTGDSLLDDASFAPNITVMQPDEIEDNDLLDEPLSLEEMSLEAITENDVSFEPSVDEMSVDEPAQQMTSPSALSLEPLDESSSELELTLEDPVAAAEPDLALAIKEKPFFTATETETPVQPAQPTNSVEKPEGAAINTWVLGASLGGPQAVRQFLAAIKEDLPVAFVLAQHIGANHISLLAEQLNRVTPFTVVAGKTGHLIKHHEVVLAPADKDIRITDDGYLSLVAADESAIYSPSIDNVMDAVANHYRNMAGTIIFSGMGDDGAKGCLSIAKYGGIVWAQDVDSCVISSMPDQARKTSTVTYSANPQALAERLYNYYRD